MCMNLQLDEKKKGNKEEVMMQKRKRKLLKIPDYILTVMKWKLLFHI